MRGGALAGRWKNRRVVAAWSGRRAGVNCQETMLRKPGSTGKAFNGKILIRQPPAEVSNSVTPACFQPGSRNVKGWIPG